MCRYAYKPYKDVFVCLSCQIGFKAHSSVECHACKGPVHSVGKDYRVPRKGSRQWKVVEALILSGFNFQTCGCGGLGYVPRTVREI